MKKILSFIPNLYFFPFIFASNIWKSKRTLVNKILLICLDLFVYIPLWIVGWSLFFFLIGVTFYIFDKDFKNIFPMLLLFIFFGFIIPGFYLIKYLLRVHQIKKIFLILLPLFAAYIVVTQFIIAPTQIAGNSMYPTLKNGDGIWIIKYYKNYQRGDIIIFKHPKNPDLEYISRLIALPKDKIKIQQGKIYLNEKLLQESYTTTPTNLRQDDFIKEGKEYIIPDNEVFVMGDNRPRSSDSREFGFVNTSSIIGKFTFRYEESKYKPTKEEIVKDLFDKGEGSYINLKYDEAIKYFKEIINIEPNHQESLTYLADIFTQKKQYEEAESYFKKSFQINKNNSHLLVQYGYYLQSKGNENEAEEYFKKALAINDTLYNALYGLGYINLNKGQYLKAEEYFNKILSTGINDAPTFHNLGAIYFHLENYIKAKEFYNKALNLYKEKGLNKEYDELYKFIQENKLN